MSTPPTGAVGAHMPSSSDLTLLRQGLSGLDLLDAGLGERAAAFVAQGADPAILQEIRAHGVRAGIVLGDPGRLLGPFHTDRYSKAEAQAGKVSLAARSTLYRLVDSAAPDITLLVRLGKVLEAAGQGHQFDPTGAAMPAWLHYLLNDALWASYDDRNGMSDQYNRPAWDIRLLAAIARQEELAATLPLEIAFEREAKGAFYMVRAYNRFQIPEALDQYMLEHRDLVGALATSLSVAGRQLLCQRIGESPALLAAFAPVVLKLAAGGSKTVRAQAAGYVERIDGAQLEAALSDLLAHGQSDERAQAADLLALHRGPAAVTILEAALAREGAKPVRQAIGNALSRLGAVDQAGQPDLPTPPPLPPMEDRRLGEDALALLLANRAEILSEMLQDAQEEALANQTGKAKSSWRKSQYEEYRKMSEDDLREAWMVLNGELAHGKRSAIARPGVSRTLAHEGRLMARADFGLTQLLRWLKSGQRSWATWYDPLFQEWMRKQDLALLDLRQLAAAATAVDPKGDDFGRICLYEVWNTSALPQAKLPAHRVWPYFAERPELIDQGLGIVPMLDDRNEQRSLGSTLSVLATFPAVPGRWLPRLLEHALGEGKTHRATAQELLAALPDIGQRVSEALASSRQEVRIEAARWLASLGYRAGVPALRAALAKETRETASAAILTALEKLGEDLSSHLAPERLLAEARKGLKGKAPAGLAWLNLDSLPACRWQDASAVEPEIIRWWVILACKLKEPAGNGLLERYLGLLDQPSRAALGTSMLYQFIARDTSHPPIEECIAYAQAEAPQLYQYYQDSAKAYPDYYEAEGKKTPEQVFEELKRQKMAEYTGSAINEKGILALAWGTPGHELVAAIGQYMRDHYPRRAQVEALLEAACVSDDPAVIQFTLGIARRYRTASVKDKARLLVERIAERNGWTQDQLADRTVPTGGFDEQGRFVLQYGSRAFTVVLDAAMKAVLQNGEGKVVSSLPPARAGESEESLKEGKQALATCKKELKQVMDMQGTRLYEAMCAGRVWPAAEWREYLQHHPIVGRLVQRLVWAECDGGGLVMRLFRPAEDGSLIDADDEQVALGDGAFVRLAHGAIVDAGQAARWLAHFKDYKLTALFAQMKRALPASNAVTDDSIADRLGWVSDTYTLRGAFNKLAYQRGSAEDGGVFFEYAKDFVGAGVRVRIEFSGSALPEDNVPAALKALSFQKIGTGRYAQDQLPIDKVPPVLLAEAYGDYHAVAAACSGFDPHWEKKVPWQ